MFRALKELIETLKMELGKIKVSSEDISFPVNISSLPMKLPEPAINVVSYRVNVNSALFKPENVPVKNIAFSKTDIVIKSGAIETSSCEVKSITEEMASSVKSVETLLFQAVPRFIKLSPFKGYVREVLRPSTRVVKKDLPHIWILTINRSPIENKEKILKAMERALKRYRGPVEDIKFLGYFKNVPLGLAKKMRIDEGRLVIELRKRGKPARYDIIALKVLDKVIVEVIS